MRYLMCVLILFASTLSACAPAGTVREQAAINPCEDARYLELKDVPLEEMSEREYEYFIQTNAACAEAQERPSDDQPVLHGLPVLPVMASALLILVSTVTLLTRE